MKRITIETTIEVKTLTRVEVIETQTVKRSKVLEFQSGDRVCIPINEHGEIKWFDDNKLIRR